MPNKNQPHMQNGEGPTLLEGSERGLKGHGMFRGARGEGVKTLIRWVGLDSSAHAVKRSQQVSAVKARFPRLAGQPASCVVSVSVTSKIILGGARARRHRSSNFDVATQPRNLKAMASSSSIETALLLASIDVPLFVIAAYLPTNRTCSQLAHTVGSVIRFHPEAHILLVDNDTPKPNLASALSYFHARGFSERLHISSRQFPSHGQLGSWLVAHALLRRARSSSGAGLLASDIALRSVTRVAMLQHSTPLKYPLPPRPHKHCRVGSLASHKPRTFYIHPREYRKDGPNVILSTIASVLGIRCMAPCVDPKTGKPVEGGASSSQQRRAYKRSCLRRLVLLLMDEGSPRLLLMSLRTGPWCRMQFWTSTRSTAF